MRHPIALSVALGLSAALANFVGGLVIGRKYWAQATLRYFIALGSGFMLATAFLEMVPESFRLLQGRAAALVLTGYLLVHFFEHSIHAHFHFGEEVHREELLGRHVGISAVGGLMIHSFFDGIAITSGFLISAWLGYIIFGAVFLHKMPEGFTAASVMLAAGRGRRAAIGAAIALGAATVAGVLTMSALRWHVGYGLPLAAGVTIYVAASDLIPEVNREPGIRMAFVVFAGVGSLLLLNFLFHH
jgi:zinc and cadmium transporter